MIPVIWLIKRGSKERIPIKSSRMVHSEHATLQAIEFDEPILLEDGDTILFDFEIEEAADGKDKPET